MEQATWRMAERADGTPETGCSEFLLLHRTHRGRIFHGPGFRRVVIDFGGACLVLRCEEFQRLRLHLGRITACGPSRARILGGERVRLRDASGERFLLLDLDGLAGLVELMEAGARRLESPGNPPVAESLGASRFAALSNGATGSYPFKNKTETESHSFSTRPAGAGQESTERPDRPYQSAFINNAIAGRAFQNPSGNP